MTLYFDCWHFKWWFICICSCHQCDLIKKNHLVYFLIMTVIFFLQDYERSLRQLSLDDIERLAGRLLHPDGEGMDTSYMDWCCSAVVCCDCYLTELFWVSHLHKTVSVVLLRASADWRLSDCKSYWLLLITAMGLSYPHLINWTRIFSHFLKSIFCLNSFWN